MSVGALIITIILRFKVNQNMLSVSTMMTLTEQLE